MIKNKTSAIEASTLVLYVILVATTLTLAGVVTMYTKLATKDAAKRACEFDINLAAFSKELPDVSKLYTRGHKQRALTNCRRDKLGNLEIKYEDVVENGVINQDKAHKIIADEMVECWKMVGAGTKDPFSNWDKRGETYCMVCSTIKFDERLTELYNKGIKRNEQGESTISEEDLKKYRIQPIYPYLTKERKGETIWEFLYNEKAIEYKEPTEYPLIYPETTIMIQMYKLESMGAKVRNMWIGTGLIIGGLILSSTGVGAAIGAPLVVTGIAGIAIGVTGISMVVHSASLGYKGCEECNAIGGIQLIPPEHEFDIKMEVEVDGKEKQIPLCTIIVN